MKITSATFKTSAPDFESCPSSDFPEFAFIGRSNVGKSSLINMITERKDLAKVSSKPGHTQLINFYLINENWCLIDLPGYGYARTGKENRIRFEGLIIDYMTKRTNLECVFVLIDSRIPPQAIDLEFVHWLFAKGVPAVLVFTKADTPSASALKKNVEAFQQGMAKWCKTKPTICITSSKTKLGRAELLDVISKIVS
jgi:GTP-binding protein